MPVCASRATRRFLTVGCERSNQSTSLPNSRAPSAAGIGSGSAPSHEVAERRLRSAATSGAGLSQQPFLIVVVSGRCSDEMSVVHPGSLSVGRQPQEHPGVVIQQLSDGCGLVALELDVRTTTSSSVPRHRPTARMSGVRSEPVTAPTIASTVSRCFTFRLG
jgi:hypothetical protein